MADTVLVEVVVNLTDQRAGDRAWVPETDRVRGMVAGGYWRVVDRRAERRRVKDAPDQAGSE